MKRSAASILVFVFVAAALLAAPSNARSHPDGVIKTIEQGDIITSLDDPPVPIPCNECGSPKLPGRLPRLSYHAICQCEDVALLSCREGCRDCEPSFFPPGFKCMDLYFYECKNRGHRFAEPAAATTIITTTPESIN